MNRQSTKILSITLIVSILVIWISLEGWAFKNFFSDPISHSASEQVISIPKGASSRQVINILVEQELMRDPLWFRMLLKFKGKDDQIKAGEIRINPNWNVHELIDALVAGKAVNYPFTFIAGETFAQALQRLVNTENIVQNLPLDDYKEIQNILQIETALEGMFLPETYFFTAKETTKSLLVRSHRDLNNILNEQWQNRADNLPLKSAYEALILASIVEKETAKDSERALVAGVFINRLNKGMRLQSDPTVIYGMGDSFDGNLRRKDLRTPTPFNTYTIRGLPPTPISLVSIASIKAVMHPATTRYIYFVADGTGGHNFSVTYAEHNIAIQEHLKFLRNRRL